MELEFVDWLRQRTEAGSVIRRGIGDDAAVLDLPSRCSVVTTDMLMDGVDFEVCKHPPRRIGRKCLAVNLSDLAAMAARPVAAFVSLALPVDGGLRLARELYEGLLELAEQFEVPVAGGDTNAWAAGLVVNVTLLGEPTGRGPLLRSGGKPGDALLVTGNLGGSIRGRHFEFLPRVREACLLHEKFQLNAAIDLSDGLSLDLARLARESNCGAEVLDNSIPIADDAHLLASDDGRLRWSMR